MIRVVATLVYPLWIIIIIIHSTGSPKKNSNGGNLSPLSIGNLQKKIKKIIIIMIHSTGSPNKNQKNKKKHYHHHPFHRISKKLKKLEVQRSVSTWWITSWWSVWSWMTMTSAARWWSFGSQSGTKKSSVFKRAHGRVNVYMYVYIYTV